MGCDVEWEEVGGSGVSDMDHNDDTASSVLRGWVGWVRPNAMKMDEHKSAVKNKMDAAAAMRQIVSMSQHL